MITLTGLFIVAVLIVSLVICWNVLYKVFSHVKQSYIKRHSWNMTNKDGKRF